MGGQDRTGPGAVGPQAPHSVPAGWRLTGLPHSCCRAFLRICHHAGVSSEVSSGVVSSGLPRGPEWLE